MSAKDKIRIGVVGVGRGRTFMHGASDLTGLELVAICDTWEEKLIKTQKEFSDLGKDIAVYTDYNRFLEHDMDAVVLANYFHQHAPFAIKAMESGRHVMSECAACSTLGEGVALARAVERTGKIYMLAENYPYMVYNQEMRKLYKEGLVGNFVYGEGEYVHPDSAETKLKRSCGMNHWRNWIPSTYYCTHSIAPVMFITDTRPVKVNGFVSPYDYNDPDHTMACKKFDMCGLLILRMDNDAVVKSLHGALRGHQNFVRIHGSKGLMENSRHGDKNMLRVRREPFDKEPGEPVEKVYLPDFPEFHEQAVRAGHGGGDFFTNYHFGEAIRRNEQPWLNVYRAIDMTICGLQGYKSVLNDSAPMEIPDFRDETVRKQYENDNWSPDPERKAPAQPLSSVRGEIKATEEAKEYAKKVWAEVGYKGE
jgi:predicted dehydrogenase